MSSEISHDEHNDIIYPSTIPFVLLHLACFGAIWSGVTWPAFLIFVTLYWLRMFAIGAGFHRLFAHRAYKTSRAFQLFLAVLSESTMQRSVLWWAAKHRQHHLHSDTELDVHSPRHSGFLYSHMGWVFARQHESFDETTIPDLMRYPELRWLHKYSLVPPAALAVLCFLAAGWSGLIIGFCWSTALLFHGTFFINSLGHVSGRKRYVTGDDSRNNWLVAIFTMGEGWHNNHHAFQSSVRQGFRWWEVDVTFYILTVLSWFGIVWDMRSPPEQLLRNEQKLGVIVINRSAEQLASHFNADRIAQSIAAALHGTELTALREKLTEAHDHTAEVLATMHLPEMPSREEIAAKAKVMFVKTRSMEDISDRAYELLLAAVAPKLIASATPKAPVSNELLMLPRLH